MAAKTITSNQSGPKLPGSTTPLFIKTETTFTPDENGNPIKGTVTTKLLYTPNGSTFFVAAESKEGGKAGSWKLKKYTPEEIFSAGITQYAQPDGSILGPTAAKSLNTQGGVLYTAAQNLIKDSASNEGISTEYQKPLASSLQNTASKVNGQSQIKLDEKEFKKSITTKARSKYSELLKYPKTIDTQYQDYIKIQMIEYLPRGLGEGKTLGIIPARDRIDTSINKGPSGEAGKTRNILGSVLLPIQGNISDNNTVRWGETPIDALSSFVASTAFSGITEGTSGLKSQFEGARTGVKNNVSDLKRAVAGKFVELASGINPLTRLYGIVANPNLELLFNGPELRNFTFSFRLSPRDADEAKEIKQIIRFFKQGMSVKRTQGELFLKSPHTFQLSYWNTNDKEHPYLNKFKECSLRRFSVNYAPDGTYMTFNGEPSMTAYEIQMDFSELEPIFDDDYTALDKDSDDQIGY